LPPLAPLAEAYVFMHVHRKSLSRMGKKLKYSRSSCNLIVIYVAQQKQSNVSQLNLTYIGDDQAYPCDHLYSSNII